MIASDMAATEAAKDGKTYVVAKASAPLIAIYALPLGHPMITEKALSIMYQLTPDGRCIHMPQPKKN